MQIAVSELVAKTPHQMHEFLADAKAAGFEGVEMSLSAPAATTPSITNLPMLTSKTSRRLLLTSALRLAQSPSPLMAAIFGVWR